MPRVSIKRQRGMSNASYHKRCISKGQQLWWLKAANGGFIDIGFHRGDQPLDITLDLLVGAYRLGTGPNKKFGWRETFEVKEGDDSV